MNAILHEDEFRFDARDGYSLSGHSIVPDEPKAAVLISAGTGFPKEVYARIARAGAQMGYACLTYDYRGIAGSAPEEMRGFTADIEDWGRLDLSAALDRAAALAPGRPLFTLGHSVGAHLLGFADNVQQASAHAVVCAGSGYWGGHAPVYRPRVLMFWLLYGPACLARKGFIPAGGIWGGTALPREVFLQWRRWAFRPGYFGDELGQLEPHLFHDITAPIRSFVFSDDPIATPTAAQAILDIYANAPSDIVALSPADIGTRHVGHHGAFRRGAEAFWPQPFSWFDRVLQTA